MAPKPSAELKQKSLTSFFSKPSASKPQPDAKKTKSDASSSSKTPVTTTKVPQTPDSRHGPISTSSPAYSLASTPPTSDPIDVDMGADDDVEAKSKSTSGAPKQTQTQQRTGGKRKVIVEDSDDDDAPLSNKKATGPSTGGKYKKPQVVDSSPTNGINSNRGKRPRLSKAKSDTEDAEDDEEDEDEPPLTKRLSRFRQAPAKKASRSFASSDVEHDDRATFPSASESEMDDVRSVKSFRSASSRSSARSGRSNRSVRSRASSDDEDFNDNEVDDDEDDEDMGDFIVSDDDDEDRPKKGKGKAKAKSKPAPKTKSGSSSAKAQAGSGDTGGGSGGGLAATGSMSFLTAAERREKKGKEDKKAAESPYKFLEDVRDKDGKRPGEPGYDSRSLYIPKSAWAEFTPFEKQFWEIKQNHYDTVLFFQKGKFFELYEDDARIGHREFDLKLTGRVKMCMVGVPEMSFNLWATKFLAKGYKVGRVEQAETALGAEMRLAAEKGKGAAKGKAAGGGDKIVRRELNKVYTNGTLLDEELLTDEQAGHCICIFENASSEQEQHGKVTKADKEVHKFGVCVLDCSTSQFNLSGFEDDVCRTRLETLMRQIRPKEVLFKKGNLSVNTHRLLKSIVPQNCLWTALRNVEGFTFDQTIDELKKVYEPKGGKEEMDVDEDTEDDYNLLPKDVPEPIREMVGNPLAIEALGCMLWYLRQLNIDKNIMSMKNFNVYDPLSKGEGLVLDGQTLAHLEILLNNEGTEEGTLLKLLSQCVTPFGKRLFRIWLCNPLRNVDDINARLDAVEALIKNPNFEEAFLKIARGLPDLERIVSRIHGKNCKVRDFLKVLGAFKRMSSGMGQLANIAAEFESTSILGLLRGSPDLGPNVKHVESLFQPVPTDVKVVDELLPREGKDEAYDEINAEIDELEKSLEQELKKMKKALGIDLAYWHSAIGTKEIYLVESDVKDKARIPKEWTKSTGTKKLNRHIVPGLQKTIRQVKEARENRNTAVKAFKLRLYDEFDLDRALWLRAVRVFAEVDCLVSLSKASKSLGEPSCKPVFVSEDENGKLVDSVLEFVELRHPTLSVSEKMGKKAFIPNDVALGEKEGKVALLTGPNMAGKSTAMRMTATAIIMAQLGMRVPAKSARLTPVDTIITRMGAYDFMFSHASTFKVEMDECCKILRNASPRSLVILDELGRGTSTFDGMAIASAVLHQLATHTLPLCFFATHYGSLTDDFKYHPNVRMMYMLTAIDDVEKKITYMYRLVPGIAEGSFGTHVATLAGVPESVVDRADVVSKDFKKQFTQRLIEKRKKLNVGGKLPLTALADFTWLARVGANGTQGMDEKEKARVDEVLRKMKAIALSYIRDADAVSNAMAVGDA